MKKYRHHRTGEDNGDAHLKRQLFGREVVVAITQGRLDLGAWEQICYAEFDGKREKRVLVKVIGEEDKVTGRSPERRLFFLDRRPDDVPRGEVRQ